jgi:hypothetical protein
MLAKHGGDGMSAYMETKRIFGGYVSRYDFKRSEEDGATVKLVYENRGEKLGVARKDLNEKIATAIEKRNLDPDQEAKLQKLLGQGLRGHHRRRPAAEDRAGLRGALRDALGGRQGDAGVHRQGDLRAHAGDGQAAVAGEGCQVRQAADDKQAEIGYRRGRR